MRFDIVCSLLFASLVSCSNTDNGGRLFDSEDRWNLKRRRIGDYQSQCQQDDVESIWYHFDAGNFSKAHSKDSSVSHNDSETTTHTNKEREAALGLLSLSGLDNLNDQSFSNFLTSQTSFNFPWKNNENDTAISNNPLGHFSPSSIISKIHQSTTSELNQNTSPSVHSSNSLETIQGSLNDEDQSENIPFTSGLFVSSGNGGSAKRKRKSNIFSLADVFRILKIPSPQPGNQVQPSESSLEQLIHQFPYGLLSWSKINNKEYRFETKFRFNHVKNYLYFGTANFPSVLIYKYSCEVVKSLVFKGKKSHEKFDNSVYRYVEEVFSAVHSFSFDFKPSYYIFGPSDEHHHQNMDCSRFPFYFIFTSISFLIKTEKKDDFKLLKSLIQLAYSRATSSYYLYSNEWDFLRKYVLGDSAQPQELSSKRVNLRYDIGTLNFIYHEMKQSSNEEVRNFFTKVWENNKNNCSREGKKQTGKGEKRIVISNNPSLIIPRRNEKFIYTFEGAVRKLYQIKFTDLLFGGWNSLDFLIEKYLELKKDFEVFAVDFRLRVFSRKDFDLLKKALTKIVPAVQNYLNLPTQDASSIDHSSICCFFIELINFINFKCTIFTYDYQKEPKKEFDYEETFSVINEITSTTRRIISLLSSNGIQIEKYSILSSIDHLNYQNPIDLSKVWNEFLDFEQKPHKIIDSNCLVVPLSFIKLSRFKCSEFITELDEIINNGNYSEVFNNEKYADLKSLWKCQPKEEFQLSPEDEEYYVKQFRIFLFHYNQ